MKTSPAVEAWRQQWTESVAAHKAEIKALEKDAQQQPAEESKQVASEEPVAVVSVEDPVSKAKDAVVAAAEVWAMSIGNDSLEPQAEGRLSDSVQALLVAKKGRETNRNADRP